MRHMLLITLFALALAGCGSPPVALASVPAYPEASELQAGQNPIADSLAETMRSSVGGLASEVQLYELPAGAGLEQVRQHYEAALADGDWAATPELTTSSDTFSTVGWQRGSGGSEQVLMLGYMPELLGQPPVLIVALFSE